MMAIPILNEPALVVTNNIRVIVIADIHLGIEWELYHRGFSISSQAEKRKKRICEYIDKVVPDRIVLLGDIKHNVPRTSWQEKKEVPDFLRAISDYAPVDIVPGNHDGDIDELVSGDVRIHGMRGFVLDETGYFHGHTWPDVSLLSSKKIIMSHNHPVVRLTDPLGHAFSEEVWIRTHFIESAIKEFYGDIEWLDPEIIIMPAFNELCGGIPFNESIHEELLGPLFSNNAIELEKAVAYLLDGTNLGTIGNIRKLKITKKRRFNARSRHRVKYK